MGMLDDGEVEFTPEDDAMLASLYAADETVEAPKVAQVKTASKKVAPKPVVKKASTGAKKLGNVRTASADGSSLESLWESAPDVSEVFNG
jgi:hypothetical protein